MVQLCAVYKRVTRSKDTNGLNVDSGKRNSTHKKEKEIERFPLKIKKKTRMPTFASCIQVLFSSYSIILKVLARAIKQEKDIKGIHIRKEEVKLYLFADDIILHVENPKESTRKQKANKNILQIFSI